MTQNNLIPYEATHPGEILKDELDARGIKQKDFALEMDVKPSFLNEILNKKRPITADLAIVLEKILGIAADYWMRFQSQYEIDRAKVKEKNQVRLKNIEHWNTIKELVPIKYFQKLGYLTDSLEENIHRINSIFDVSSIDELVQNNSNHKLLSFYRTSQKLSIDEKNMFAWDAIVKNEAKKQRINTFHSENLASLKSELQLIFYENNNVINSVKTKLNQYGIKLVLIEKFEKTPIDGVSFWSGNNPAIGLTLRHKRIDNFAFTILHELGHIELHLLKNKEKVFFDITNSKSKDHFENEADSYAQTALIPQDNWDDILTNHLPLDDEKIVRYGEKHKINPAIILGRACYEMNYYAIKTTINKELR
jgi:HTH-type transcriptional regulator/antitoxin HigA